MDKRRIPRELLAYAENKRILEIFQNMFECLIINRPEKPIDFLCDLLKKQGVYDVPRVYVLGLSPDDRKLVCRTLSEKLQLTYLTQNSLGMDPEQNASKEQMAPTDTSDSTWARLLKERVAMTDCVQKGWLLEDLPKTKRQAFFFRKTGLFPTHIVFINDADVSPRKTKSNNYLDSGEEFLKSVKYREQINLILDLHKNSYLKTFHIKKYAEAEKLLNEVVEFVRSRQRPPFYYVPRILLLGPYGSGRRTIAKKLTKQFRIIEVNNKEELRRATLKDSPLKDELNEIMKTSKPVPDDLLVKIASERLLKEDCVENGWVMYNFPYTKHQAELLIKALQGFQINRAVFLDSSLQTCLKRVEGRRWDSTEGRFVYLENKEKILQAAKQLQLSDSKSKVQASNNGNKKQATPLGNQENTENQEQTSFSRIHHLASHSGSQEQAPFCENKDEASYLEKQQQAPNTCQGYQEESSHFENQKQVSYSKENEHAPHLENQEQVSHIANEEKSSHVENQKHEYQAKNQALASFSEIHQKPLYNENPEQLSHSENREQSFHLENHQKTSQSVKQEKSTHLKNEEKVPHSVSQEQTSHLGHHEQASQSENQVHTFFSEAYQQDYLSENQEQTFHSETQEQIPHLENHEQVADLENQEQVSYSENQEKLDSSVNLNTSPSENQEKTSFSGTNSSHSANQEKITESENLEQGSQSKNKGTSSQLEKEEKTSHLSNQGQTSHSESQLHASSLEGKKPVSVSGSQLQAIHLESQDEATFMGNSRQESHSVSLNQNSQLGNKEQASFSGKHNQKSDNQEEASNLDNNEQAIPSSRFIQMPEDIAESVKAEFDLYDENVLDMKALFGSQLQNDIVVEVDADVNGVEEVYEAVKMAVLRSVKMKLPKRSVNVEIS